MRKATMFRAVLLSLLLLASLCAGAYAARVAVLGATVASGTTDVQAIAANSRAPACVAGFVFTENAAGAARVRLHHGTSGSDPAIGDWHLAASETKTIDLTFCIEVPAGLFVDRVSGTSVITILTEVR